jgi:ankyrin repeat protein
METKKSFLLACVMCVFFGLAVYADPAGDMLVRAAQQMDEEALKQALWSRANVNYTFNERTALMEACSNQWLSGVRILVEENKANISYKNMLGQTALMFAVSQNKDIAIAKFLIDRGANVNDRDLQNKTVLMYAVEQNQTPAMIDFILQAGASTGATNSKREDALILAAKNSNWAAVDALLRQSGINTSQADVDGKTAFIYACENEDTNMMAAFVRRGFDVLKQDVNGIPPLLYLIQHKMSYTAIEYLVKNTNALNSRDRNGRDAKWYADRYEGDTRLRRLLESGR